MNPSDRYDALIAGGGFFGMYLAAHLAGRGQRVLLVEKEHDFMLRASYANQARVHNGYHYPRSILTALRSRVSFPRFVAEFSECIVDDFEKYYAIGRVLGKVTARQFELFCRSIDAFCEPAPYRVCKLFDPHLVEGVFHVKECAFDAAKLRSLMRRRLDGAGVEYLLSTSVRRVAEEPTGALAAYLSSSDRNARVVAGLVLNCAYSCLNRLLQESGLALIPLKHEVTEMCLVEVPEEIRNMGITIMCGPFFSLMPFPPLGVHSFSHVRYTPHYEWYDSGAEPCTDAHALCDRYARETHWPHMMRDAQRFLPVLAGCVYKDSLWEIKTVLPRSEVDDSRPILFRPHQGFPNLHCIMGGKIDNIYDVVTAIDALPRGTE